MCHSDTRLRGLWLVLWAAATASGQTAPATLHPEWRHIGNTSLELLLASPASGPVDNVWFSADGSHLYTRTHSGLAFETTDFENWKPAAFAISPPGPDVIPAVERLPAPGARLRPDPVNPARLYGLAADLYRTEDGGRTWVNLTAYGDGPVIGGPQRDLAVSPLDPNQVVVANDFGVWRSLDGGLSWNGLNQLLPNLPVRRILATPGGSRGVRVVIDGIGAAELQPGGDKNWRPAPEPALVREAELKRVFSAALGAQITAIAEAGDTIYAGASDGRLWFSADRGQTWRPSQRPPGDNPVEALFVDAQQPRMALAALAGSGPHVLRTTNSGLFFDDISMNLPDIPAHGVTADRAAGAVYLATDRGVFYTRADLDSPGPASNWVLLSDNLPQTPARDVRLDPAGNQLYIALEGHGVYATAAPHRSRVVRLVNAADFSTRAAAPGSLLSVIGARVRAAQADGLNYPVLAASDTESQLQVPFEVVGPSVALAIDAIRDQMTLPLSIQNVSPAIFIDKDGAPLLLDADSGMMLGPLNTAHSNSRIQVLMTGLGKVRPDWPTGVPAPLENPPQVTAALRAYLDSIPVEVTRAALAPGYIGYYLVQLQLPSIVNAGPAELYLVSEGQESNRVRIYLEP